MSEACKSSRLGNTHIAPLLGGLSTRDRPEDICMPRTQFAHIPFLSSLTVGEPEKLERIEQFLHLSLAM
ncbi:MAG: hypothetical protein ACK53Y_21355, partial [bacterium]